MSFHNDASKVRQMDLPFTKRRVAFRSCVGRYIWLTNGNFNNTYSRYSNHFGFDADVPDANDRLTQAMDALKKELQSTFVA